MDSSYTHSERYNNFHGNIPTNDLKPTVANSLHITHHSILHIEGIMTVYLIGANTPLKVTLGDSFMSEVVAQSLTISQYDRLLNEKQSSHSQSTSCTSMNELPLDLSMKASALQSQKETPVKTGSETTVKPDIDLVFEFTN
ncbi:unnamed protein product [Rodentolepis nana]|uniref:Reverse transcriptase domain-containing protein n=1 Tax=Rodentolepis nana TaxID=102285 RepID=A0A0R3T306_RODNA|nr:unnamed protein product [Rodentolepis nana]